MTELLAYLDAHPWAMWTVGTIVAGLFSLLMSKRSQIDAWAESNPRVAGVMKLLRGFGVDPWLIAQGVMLIVAKRLPATSLEPKTRRSLPPLPLLVLCFVAFILVRCAAAKPIPDDPAARAAHFADAVRKAVKAKEDAKRFYVAAEQRGDDAIRELCSSFIFTRPFAPASITADDVVVLCAGYLVTPEPAKLEPPPPPAPEPELLPLEDTDAGATVGAPSGSSAAPEAPAP